MPTYFYESKKVFTNTPDMFIEELKFEEGSETVGC